MSDISSVVWLILMVVFLAAEAATVQLVSVWFAVGSLCAMVVSLLNGSLWLQILVFFVISIALLAFLTGGCSTCQLIGLPLIAPRLEAMGLSLNMIHRVSTFASTNLDTMPYCGSVLMLLNDKESIFTTASSRLYSVSCFPSADAVTVQRIRMIEREERSRFFMLFSPLLKTAIYYLFMDRPLTSHSTASIGQ